jgi:hypothetical protein
MEMPKWLTDIVARATRENGDDIPSAVDAAEAGVRRHPEFPDVVDTLVRDAIQGAVYAARGLSNRELKSETCYGGPAKVRVGDSESIGRVYQSVFDYYIGSRTLGDLLGSELEDVEVNETEKAAGHMFNARLAAELRKVVPADKRVREAVSQKKLEKLFKSLRGRAAETMAGAARE